jgi:hypothetical protein
MTLSRFPPGGSRQEPPRPVDCHRLLQEVAEDLARELGRPFLLAADSLPRVTLRPGSLRAVFRHLLAEAFPAVSPGEAPQEVPPKVEVGCHLTEGNFRFFVRHLPREIPACLAHVRELVEREGGRVWMERGEAGSVVWFSLPADPVPA